MSHPRLTFLGAVPTSLTPMTADNLPSTKGPKARAEKLPRTEKTAPLHGPGPSYGRAKGAARVQGRGGPWVRLAGLPGWGPSSLHFSGPHIISYKNLQPGKATLSSLHKGNGNLLRLQRAEPESQAAGKPGEPLPWDVSPHVDYGERR